MDTTAPSTHLLSHLRELARTRDLIWAWTGRTIQARYQQSLLGGLWAILQPLATVAVFTVIFTLFIPVDTGDIPYVVFSYTAMVPWTLFSTSLNDMVASLITNMNLVKQIYFPREILPLSALLARLLDFFIAAGLLVVLMVIYRMPFFPQGWLFLPVILTIQLALSLGLGFIGSAINVFYRDVTHLIALVIQLWFYASPIIYPITMVPERLRPFYYLNPMAGTLEAYRAVLLYQKFPGTYLILSAVVAFATLTFGYWLFKRVEFQFADIV